MRRWDELHAREPQDRGVERRCALIRQSGKHPLILLLILGVAVVITTVGADLPRLH